MIITHDLDDVLEAPDRPVQQHRLKATRPAGETPPTEPGDTLCAQLERMERLARLEDIARLNLEPPPAPARSARQQGESIERTRHQVLSNLAVYEPVLLGSLRRRITS